MSRRTKVLGAAFLLTLVGFAWLLYVNRDRVTRTTFEHVAVGMSSDEVEALFNRPPDLVMRIHGVVRDSSTFVAVPRGQTQKIPRHQLHQWASSELTAAVIFEGERVVCRYTGEGQPDAWYQRFLRAVERSFRAR